MSAVKVNVKWMNGKTTLEGVELNKNESPSIFKAQVLTLTGVPVDRQRLMFKGAVIKDDAWPENFEIVDGAMFMLMGSSEKLPEAPKEKPKFIEDMSENELAVALDLPAGLTNMGNTCYMSATVQCLKTVPELIEALNKCDVNLSLLESLSNEPSSQGVTAALRDLYQTMEGASVTEPLILLRMIHRSIPRFAQRGEGNTFQQQDANECWTELLRILQQNLKPLEAEKSKHDNFIDQYFGGVFEAEMKCDEAADEPVAKSEENFLQLSCFISQEVRYLQAGLISRMKETITKFSPSLNRDASYTKTSRISRLPAYLTVQFVRFHYKENVQTSAKLLRDVKFTMILDVHDLCTKELQEKLAPMRAKYKLVDDKIASGKADEVSSPSSTSTSSDAVAATNAAGSKQVDLAGLKKYSFEDDPGSNNSGFYELMAVLTHKGRSSASGHYVAWIKKDGQWFKCDDDYVEAVDSDDILKLSGGGDWHCAYVCLYGPRLLNDK